MIIQGKEIDDDLIDEAVGEWHRDTYARIELKLSTGGIFKFESDKPEEVAAMCETLYKSVMLAARKKRQ